MAQHSPKAANLLLTWVTLQCCPRSVSPTQEGMPPQTEGPPGTTSTLVRGTEFITYKIHPGQNASVGTQAELYKLTSSGLEAWYTLHESS